MGLKCLIRQPLRSCLDHVVTNIHEDHIQCGVLDETCTNHLPTYAIVSGLINQVDISDSTKNEEVFWRFIDERKKDVFLDTLKEKLSIIDLSSNPEVLLETLTSATKDAIETCFPLKKMSKRAKKRAKLPWFNTDIFKDEKNTEELIQALYKNKKP